jgi:alpha-beta hydrolase superfamily lysophospholipase
MKGAVFLLRFLLAIFLLFLQADLTSGFSIAFIPAIRSPGVVRPILPSFPWLQQRKNRYIHQRDFGFDYDAIQKDLPPSLASVPAIQQLESCFDSARYTCEHGWIDSVDKDGAKLHYRRFLPMNKKNPKGIIVWLHGIQGFGGGAFVLETGPAKMALVADRFVGEEGYAVYALDLYGHGYSEGRRFYVQNFEWNLDDVQHFVETVSLLHAPHTPLFCAGESYGGCLAIHLANRLQHKLDSILLLAPAILPAKLPPQPVTFLLKQVLARLAPRWQPFFMPHPVNPERVWRDPSVRKMQVERASQPYIGGSGTRFRLGTAVQLLRALEQCYHQAVPGLELPFCVVHGDMDVAVPHKGTDYLVATAPAQERAVRKEEGAFHDLLADPSRNQVVDFLMEWTEQRIHKKQQKG